MLVIWGDDIGIWNLSPVAAVDYGQPNFDVRPDFLVINRVSCGLSTFRDTCRLSGKIRVDGARPQIPAPRRNK